MDGRWEQTKRRAVAGRFSAMIAWSVVVVTFSGRGWWRLHATVTTYAAQIQVQDEGAAHLAEEALVEEQPPMSRWLLGHRPPLPKAI